MGTIKLHKESVVVADIALGMGTVAQIRGTQDELNASHIPFDATKSVTDELNLKESASSVDAKLALKAELAGLATQLFNVAVAVDPSHAVDKAQFDAAIALLAPTTYVDSELTLKADKTNVLELDNLDAFAPVSDYQPSTKKYVDDTLIGIGAGDMTKAVYDNNDDGYVDSTAGVGKSAELMGISTHDQVMRLSQSNVTDCNILTTFGIFIGNDVINAPQLGLIGLEQLYFSGGRAQRCLAFSTRQWYYRDYNDSSTTWSAWRIMDGSDRLPFTGGVMTGPIDLTQDISLRGMLGPQAYDLVSMGSAGPLFNGQGLGATFGGYLNFSTSIPTTDIAQGTAVNEMTRKDYVDGVNTTQDATIAGKELALGNPTADGMALMSTVAGVRSWAVAGNPLAVISDIATEVGSDRIINMVSLTQAEYDTLTPVATTMYIITD